MGRELKKIIITLSIGSPLLLILISAMGIVPKKSIPFALGVGFGGLFVVLIEITFEHKLLIKKCFLRTTKVMFSVIKITIMPLLFFSSIIVILFLLIKWYEFFGTVGFFIIVATIFFIYKRFK